jgi:hypothetical protein
LAIWLNQLTARLKACIRNPLINIARKSYLEKKAQRRTNGLISSKLFPLKEGCSTG